ncbi:MAG TPA: phosphoribosyltransferase [Acetobacteraceae bacterium]|nr:phosphoribosyltransferase [Acetobacteraceae bacterium]
MTFADRREAGRRLAGALERLRDASPIVLALPRGGVPVGFEIAQALAAPLDVLLVRKIGAPGREELGIGAVVEGAEPQIVLDEELLRLVDPPPGYVEAETARQIAEIERRRHIYVGGHPPPALQGHTIIVADDGVATGSTARAALRALRQFVPRSLVLAVPVAPEEALASLSEEADEVVCLLTPRRFHAVGAYYDDFRQMTDLEVIELLETARHPS